MQHNKVTENLGEFQKFIDSDTKTGLCLEDTKRFFDIRRIFGKFESVKQRGIGVNMIMTTLLVMLFYRSRNIYSYFSRQYGKLTTKEGGKNPYYDLLGNEHIDWRTILYLFAKRYLNLSGRVSNKKDGARALIFDDSPIKKSGKKIEAVSKVHDHVSGKFIFGYKLLVSGYWDGANFIPVDFSFHRERGSELDKARDRRNRARRKAKQAEVAYLEHKKRHVEERTVLNRLKKEMAAAGSKKNITTEYEKQEKWVAHSKKRQSELRKKMKQAYQVLEEKEAMLKDIEKRAPLYGLSPSERRKQFSKKRDSNSPGHERRAEADISKTRSVVKMLSRAVKRGFEFEYVLFDSWFFSKEILYHIESFRTKSLKLIAMVKMGKVLYRDALSGKEMNAAALRKRYRDKANRSRKYNARYIKVPVWYGGRRLNLFFVKLGSGKKWRAFITNDLNIGFNKLIETYQIRWTIEVFFKDAKQHLQLGKCQCNNFDSQIGSTTIAMMQYMMLLLYKQMHYGNSLGSIFDLLSSQAEEENITRYIMGLFQEIVTGIGKILKVDCIDLLGDIIRDSKKAEELMRYFSPLFEKKEAA